MKKFIAKVIVFTAAGEQLDHIQIPINETALVGLEVDDFIESTIKDYLLLGGDVEGEEDGIEYE